MAYGPLHPEVMLSPRVAPAIVGMGLLETIPETDILALADPDDADSDGISGRPNMVWDVLKGKLALGRFGWKANQPTVEQQTAGAFLGDMGITSTLFPDENFPEAQPECLAAPNGGGPEIPDDRFAKVVFYTQTLAVPVMRNLEDPRVARGAPLFAEAGCNQCHTPSHTTGEHSVSAGADQTIYPYTDLLLHDMGEGLADGATDFDASGREWRTPPAVGHRPGRNRERPHHVPARRAGSKPHGSDSLARRGGSRVQGIIPGLNQRGTGILGQVPGVAVRPVRWASALWILGLAAALLTLAACGGNGSPDPGETKSVSREDVLTSLTTLVIVPRYRQAADAMGRLADSVET